MAPLKVLFLLYVTLLMHPVFWFLCDFTHQEAVQKLTVTYSLRTRAQARMLIIITFRKQLIM